MKNVLVFVEQLVLIRLTCSIRMYVAADVWLTEAIPERSVWALHCPARTHVYTAPPVVCVVGRSTLAFCVLSSRHLVTPTTRAPARIDAGPSRAAAYP